MYKGSELGKTDRNRECGLSHSYTKKSSPRARIKNLRRPVSDDVEHVLAIHDHVREKPRFELRRLLTIGCTDTSCSERTLPKIQVGNLNVMTHDCNYLIQWVH